MSAVVRLPTVAGSPLLRGLAEQYAAAAAGQHGPEWLHALRRDALDAAVAQGLPGSREEAWKYTALRGLERQRFVVPVGVRQDQGFGGDWDAAVAAMGSSYISGGEVAARLVFVNGAFDAGQSVLDGLPGGVECVPLSHALSQPDADALLRRLFATPSAEQPADAFRRLNAALANDGVVLRVAAGTTVPAPIELLFIGAPEADAVHWALRNLVDLGEGASMTLVERWLDQGEVSHLGNTTSHIALAQGAKLCHLRLQQGGAASNSIASTRVTVAADAAYCPVALELGGKLSRHALDVQLQGSGARSTLRGVVLAADRQQVDMRYTITHAVGDTQSDTLWRAIAGGRARSAFHGGIHIAAGADGSDAALETKNLLLSEGAEIDAQPVLVIEADEVKASHGATVGQLDARALFYLRSRGLPEREARHLLVRAFCDEVLDRACTCAGADAADGPWPALHEAIGQRLAGIGQAPVDPAA